MEAITDIKKAKSMTDEYHRMCLPLSERITQLENRITQLENEMIGKEEVVFREISEKTAKKEIIEYLLNTKGAKDTVEIAEKLRIPYNIVNKICNELHRKGAVYRE